MLAYDPHAGNFVVTNQSPNRARAASVSISSGTSGVGGLTPHNRFDGSVPQPRHPSVAPMLKKQNKSVPESVRLSIKIVTLVTEVVGGVIGP